MKTIKRFLINIKNNYAMGKRILSDPYFIETFSATQIAIHKKPRRTVIINFLLSLTPAQNYVEIGVRNPEKNFNRITCKNKYSVDPGLEFEENPVDFQMTSDDFFQGLKDGNFEIPSNLKFDVIFIDGLHLANQVEKDILNSLNFITEKGFIVLHDCNPPTEFHARETYNFKNSPARSFWNGTTWKTFYRFRHQKDLFSICFDTDWGVGVISKYHYPGFNNMVLPIKNPYFEFNTHLKNIKENINLQPFSPWAKSIK